VKRHPNSSNTTIRMMKPRTIALNNRISQPEFALSTHCQVRRMSKTNLKDRPDYGGYDAVIPSSIRMLC
jgi:hypothetical protein